MGFFNKEIKWKKSMLKKMETKIPLPEKLLPLWDKIPVEDREAMIEIANRDNWFECYLTKLGKVEESLPLLLLFWGEKMDNRLEILEKIVRKIGDESQEVSLASVKLIEEIHDLHSLPFLLSALLDDKHYLPARVSQAIISFGDEAGMALASLYQKVADDDKLKVRILGVIGEIQSFFPENILKQAMNDSNKDVKTAACECVASLNLPNADKFLAPVLENEDGAIRTFAVNALGKIGDENCIRALRHFALTDNDWRVKSTANAYIKRFEENIRTSLLVDEAEYLG